MKVLYLMRHAKSETSFPGNNDHSRKLTEKGLADATLMAKKLIALDEIPETIVCSTAARTKTTAQQVAAVFGFDENKIEGSHALYNASVSEVLSVIHMLNNTFDRIMLVGHNPSFSYLAYELCGYELDHLPTSGIIKVSFNCNSWTDAKKGKFGFVISPKD